MREYISRYEKAEEECNRKDGNMKLGEDMRCFHLLEGSNINYEKKQLVFAYCGKGTWKFSEFKEGLINILGEEREVKESKEKKEGWWGDNGMMVQEGGRKNSLNQYGNVRRCILCRSEWHFARSCPRRGSGEGMGRGRGRFGGGQSWEIKQGEMRREKVAGRGCLMSEMENVEKWAKAKHNTEQEEEQVKKDEYFFGKRDESEEDEYQEMWAIVDTGCEKSVIGEK